MIRKVGKLVGKMTYGVSADNMEKYFQRSFQARDDLPIGHYEYANALTYVYGDKTDQCHGGAGSGACAEDPRPAPAEAGEELTGQSEGARGVQPRGHSKHLLPQVILRSALRMKTTS